MRRSKRITVSLPCWERLTPLSRLLDARLGAAVSALVSLRVTTMLVAPEKLLTPPEEEYPTPSKDTV